MPAEGKNVWLQIQRSDGGEVYDLVVVEEAAMEQKVEFTAMELAKRYTRRAPSRCTASCSIPARSTICPESAAVLATIGEVLKSEPTLALEVQGHTDNVGKPAANLKLSRERAAAVKAYLVAKHNVSADRLVTSGFGDTKPIADNATEDGRSRNRRVELVRR